MVLSSESVWIYLRSLYTRWMMSKGPFNGKIHFITLPDSSFSKMSHPTVSRKPGTRLAPITLPLVIIDRQWMNEHPVCYKVNIRPINSNSLQADLPNGGWRSVRHDSDPMNQLMSCPWVQQSLLGYTTCMELRAKPAKESLGHYSYLGFSYSPSNWWAVILQLLALSVKTRDYRQYPEACNEHLLDAESKRWCMISWCMRSVGKTAFNILLQRLCTTVHEDVYFENAKNRVRNFNNVELNKSQTRAKDSITRTRCADKVELHSGDGEACEKKPTTTERCNSPADTWKTFR